MSPAYLLTWRSRLFRTSSLGLQKFNNLSLPKLRGRAIDLDRFVQGLLRVDRRDERFVGGEFVKKMGIDNTDVQQEVEQTEPIAPGTLMSRVGSTTLVSEVHTIHMVVVIVYHRRDEHRHSLLRSVGSPNGGSVRTRRPWLFPFFKRYLVPGVDCRYEAYNIIVFPAYA
jgi:hypothetical protein